MPYCDNKEIIFLHIPKTGGTTISKIFDIPFLHDPNPGTTPTPQHLTCDMLRERVGNEKYDSYYKFTFVRNPWSRILSSYFWRQSLPKKRPILSFGDFVENARQVVSDRQYYQQEFGDHFIPQVEYTHDVNDIFRFEDFENGIRTVAVKLGVTIENIPLKRPKHYDNYWEFYDGHTRAKVAEIYQDEIEKFSYEFGGVDDSTSS